MGLLDRVRGISDPVDGSFQLVACSVNTGGAVYQNCAMDGVVYGPGVPPTPVHHSTLAAPTAKWPQPGQVLPVTFDRAHPDRLKIRWDEIPTAAQSAGAYAQQLAQQMRSAPPAYAPPPPYGSSAAAPPAPSYPSPPAYAMPNGRPAPGQPGGGLSLDETAAALAGGGASIGLVPTTARVLAAHEVDPQVGPGGTWDLTLDVAPTAAAAGYSAVLRIAFSSPARRAEIAEVGRTLPVLADYSRHDRIAVDPSRL